MSSVKVNIPHIGKPRIVILVSSISAAVLPSCNGRIGTQFDIISVEKGF